METDLDLGQGFRNTYEQSKFEGERAIGEAADGLPLVIARPSISSATAAAAGPPRSTSSTGRCGRSRAG